MTISLYPLYMTPTGGVGVDRVLQAMQAVAIDRFPVVFVEPDEEDAVLVDEIATIDDDIAVASTDDDVTVE